MKQFTSLALLLLGLIMIFLGITKNILPPALTGLGFVFIAAYIFKQK